MKLKPHQEAALEAIVASKAPRGQVLMACGTGKTLIALRAAEALGAQTVLVLAPTLALIHQLLGVFRAHAKWSEWSALAVCSDQKVGYDETQIDAAQVGCDVTMQSWIARDFLEDGGVRVVFCTYASSHLLEGLSFDVAIFDEAHKTAGRNGKPFAFALSEENVRIKRRLFFTATPRVEGRVDDEMDINSMNNAAIYGHRLYEMNVRAAREADIICPYKILIAEVTAPVDKTREAVQVAVVDAMREHAVRKAFTFHHKIESAKLFVDKFHDPNTEAYHVNGSMDMSYRANLMVCFKAAERAIMSNARCLTEGIDLPSVDMVVFADAKKSVIDMVQAIGRVMRKAEGKKFGYVFVPVFRQKGEKLEEAAARTASGQLLDVLRALATQDEVLEAQLKLAWSTGDISGLREFIELDGGADMEWLTGVVKTAVVDLSSTDWRKEWLRARARSGAPKPSMGDEDPFLRSMARAYYTYVSRSHNSYDEALAAELRPLWRENLRPEEFKKEIREAIERGGPVDKWLKQRAQRYVQPKGSAFDPEMRDLLLKNGWMGAPRQRLAPETVAEVRRRHEAGEKHHVIGEAVGLARSTVSRIVEGGLGGGVRLRLKRDEFLERLSQMRKLRVEGHTHSEIGRRFGLTAGTVRKALSRARRVDAP